jgi:hypothetical protein
MEGAADSGLKTCGTKRIVECEKIMKIVRWLGKVWFSKYTVELEREEFVLYQKKTGIVVLQAICQFRFQCKSSTCIPIPKPSKNNIESMPNSSQTMPLMHQVMEEILLHVSEISTE